MTPPVPRRNRFPFWLVLLAAAGTFALTMGTRQTMGLFLSPVNTSTGLGLASISLAFAFGQLWWGLTQPFAGAMADKIGAGRVLFIGVLLVALGTFITPFMTTTCGPDPGHRRAVGRRRGHGRPGGADGGGHPADSQRQAGPGHRRHQCRRLLRPVRDGADRHRADGGRGLGQRHADPRAAGAAEPARGLPAQGQFAAGGACRPQGGEHRRGDPHGLAPSQLPDAGRRLLRVRLPRGLPGHPHAGRDRVVRPAHAMGRLVAGDDRPVQHRRQRRHGLGRGPLAHEVAAVAGLRRARHRRAGVPARRPRPARSC